MSSPLIEELSLLIFPKVRGFLQPDIIRDLLPLLPEYLIPSAVSIAIALTSYREQSLSTLILDGVTARLSQPDCEALFKEQLLEVNVQKGEKEFQQTRTI